MNVASITRRPGWLGHLSAIALPGELLFLAGNRLSRMGVCVPQAGVPTAEFRARRRDPKRHFASVIDYRHNIVEHMAYVEEKGNYSSQKFPRKPEFPR